MRGIIDAFRFFFEHEIKLYTKPHRRSCRFHIELVVKVNAHIIPRLRGAFPLGFSAHSFGQLF